MRFADLDGVTVDGFGTLLVLSDPLPALERALAARGVRHSRDEIANAFEAEVRHYRPRAHLGRDEPSLAALRRECVAVFLNHARASIGPGVFVDDFLDALVFRPAEGAVETLEGLRARGLKLGLVADWDCSLHRLIVELDLARLFEAVVTSAEAGTPKPDPAAFRLALARLGVEPPRALHVGDEAADEEGARAAGIRFARAPLVTAFQGWE